MTKQTIHKLRRRKALLKATISALAYTAFSAPCNYLVVIYLFHHFFHQPWHQSMITGIFSAGIGVLGRIPLNMTERYREVMRYMPMKPTGKALVINIPWIMLLGAGLIHYAIFRIPMFLQAIEMGVVATVVFYALDYLTSLGKYKTQLKSYRKQHGLCEKCGYDLCQSPSRCPECGLPSFKAFRKAMFSDVTR